VNRYPPPDKLTSCERTRQASSKTVPMSQRIALVALALALLALLVYGENPDADARGHGTHQQLGLPPCTFYVIFQRPCPACGMTTSWAWLLREK